MSVVDTTSYINSTYSSYDASTTTSSSELGQDEFLELLVTQLENQDPLNPLEDTEMIAELAQFSSLEQMTAMNEGIETLNSQFAYMGVNTAVSYIGKDVVASGNAIAKNDDAVSDVYYELSEDVESLTAHIYDSDGNLVNSVELSDTSSGEHTFSWDGLNSDGGEETDGDYTVGFEAYDEYGAGVTVSAEVAGTVVALSSENGSTTLELSDGRSVNLLYVSKVQDSSSTTDTTQ